MSARAAKRVRLSRPDAEDAVDDLEDVRDSGNEAEELSEGKEESGSGSETGVTDEEDAIRHANDAAHAPKPKQRRRALDAEAFGSKLQDLLAAPAPTAKQLASLHRPHRKAQAEAAVERKAHRLVQQSKHAHEERGHVTDIITGWTSRPAVPFREWPNLPSEQLDAPGGQDAERALRRLAQKGVVKLFNAIRAAQGSAPASGAAGSNASTTSKKRKAIMPKEETPDLLAGDKKAAAAASKTAPNVLGSKGKEQALSNLSRDSFLSILKSGGTNKSAAPSLA